MTDTALPRVRALLDAEIDAAARAANTAHNALAANLSAMTTALLATNRINRTTDETLHTLQTHLDSANANNTAFYYAKQRLRWLHDLREKLPTENA
jgi:hypothetical protein